MNWNLLHERILAGTVAGVSIKKIRGRNAAISNSAETVWGAGSTYARLSSAVAMEVVSSSANDTAAGTGARTVEIDCIDSNYAQTTQTATLDGTTPVALSGTQLAINGIRIASAGSGLVNAGNIDVRTVSGSTVKRRMTTGATLGAGQDADFIYTIPAGYRGFLKSVSFSGITVTGDLTVYLNSHDSAGIVKNEGAGQSSLYVTGFNGAVGKIDFGSSLFINEKTLIELRAIVSAGAGDLVAMSELLLVNVSDIANPFGF